jgi:hypothetical protein
MSKQIVIAWVDMDGLKATGRTVTRDMNCFPEFIACEKAHSAMWLNDGTDEDVKKAEAYAKAQGYKVFAFTGEADPRGKAEKLVMSGCGHKVNLKDVLCPMCGV